MKILLNKGWTLNYEGKNYDTALPTSNYATLLAYGYPNPFYRDNEKNALEIAEKDCVFSKNFSVDKTLLGDKLFLRLSGVDTLAEISLNGETLVRTNNAHVAVTVDVSGKIKTDNELRILLRSPVKYIAKKKTEGYLPKNPNGLQGINAIRKSACQFGWDWGPVLPESGIAEVALLSYTLARVTGLKVDQIHDNGNVSLSVKATSEIFVENRTPSSAASDKNGVSEIIEVEGNGFSYRGEYHDNMIISIKNPKIWSINKGTLDTQPLYTVRYVLQEKTNDCFSPSKERRVSSEESAIVGYATRVGISDTHSDERKQKIPDNKTENSSKASYGRILDVKTLKIGLRTIELNREKDQFGENYCFVLNGEKIFACGANVIPFDSFVSRETNEKLKYYVEAAVKANMNILRVWGGGHFGSDAFFDLCDEYGILVWQDLLFACNLYPFGDKGFSENVNNEIMFNVEHLRHHASLAMWCGNNEFEHMHYMWTNKKGWKDQNHTYFYETLPKMLRKVDDITPYVPGSPIGDGYMKNVSSDNFGDTHLWGVWHGLKPLNNYRKRLTRFCSEFGIESMPSRDTIDSFAKNDDLSLKSPIFLQHQKCRKGNEKMRYYAAKYYGVPKNFDDMIYVSQCIQADGICDAVEHWRRNMRRCNGAIIWQFNDCWPTASWSMIDYSGKYKAIQYKARELFAPVSISIEANKGNARAFLLNGTAKIMTLNVRCGVKTFDGEELACATKSVKIDAKTSLEIYSADADSLLTNGRRLCYLYAELYEGDKVAMRKTCLFDLARKVSLPKCKITIDTDETSTEYRAILRSDKYARNVMLDIDGVTEPFSENFFDLEPNSTKIVSISKEKVTAAQWHLLSVKTLTDIEMESNIKRLLCVLRFPLI